jgi:hypothetical protein
VDDPRPGFWKTSEYMLGRVGVLVVLVESNGSLDPDIEDWQEWRMSLVMRKLTLSTAEAGRFSVC